MLAHSERVVGLRIFNFVKSPFLFLYLKKRERYIAGRKEGEKKRKKQDSLLAIILKFFVWLLTVGRGKNRDSPPK